MTIANILFWGTAWLLLSVANAAQGPLFQSKDYEEGKLGVYPRLSFKSTPIRAPQLNIVKWDPACESDHFLFLAPHGENFTIVPDNEPVIMDQKGNLVWRGKEEKTVNHLKVQRYKGRDYLTYWTGNNELRGHGTGVFKMLDQTYSLAYEIQSIKNSTEFNITGDSHEFTITQDDTAIMTSYVAMKWDLTKYNVKDGWIWDCFFQEVDIETNKLLFEWRATDHFHFDDMATDTIDKTIGKKETPWDWFHINSVEKDPWGNYLMSARYTNAIHYINGTTGKIIWNLGGKHNSFKDLSDGRATDFMCQHMARWRDDYTTITLFDNHAYWRKRVQPSKILKIRVDTQNMTAELVQELKPREGYISESQGAVDVLENGHFFVGWGFVSAFTQYSPDGELLCETHFAPLHTDQGKLKVGRAQSYRTYKQHWVGYPKENPRVKFSERQLYVSWNGATDVTAWNLEGGELVEDGVKEWKKIGTFNKTGFESNITLDKTDWSVYKLTALDYRDINVAAWTVNAAGIVKVHVPQKTMKARIQEQAPTFGGPIVVVICVILLILVNRPRLVSSGQRFVYTALKPMGKSPV